MKKYSLHGFRPAPITEKEAVATRCHQGIPGIERLDSGRLFATWYGGELNGEGPGNYVVLATSADNGLSWKEIQLVAPTNADERAYDPTLWLDPDGRLWWGWSQCVTNGIWDVFDGRSGVWVAVCDDPDTDSPAWSVPRRIAEAYGPESVELEDMYYRLDRDLADFLTFLFAQVKDQNALVVLTSDHGTSPSYDAGREEAERFNSRQFEVIVNGFLNVRYGTGEWVVAYGDKSLWLNHNLIYERGLDLAEIQNEVAIFAMQFSGVSHALAASAMRTSYFGSGYARKMQNSFYPRRSGDVILNLMPGWIEETDRCRSASGSMYGYDTEVPLVFYGKEAGAMRVNRAVDMTAVAPTLARLAGVREPAASEGTPLEEIVDM